MQAEGRAHTHYVYWDNMYDSDLKQHDKMNLRSRLIRSNSNRLHAILFWQAAISDKPQRAKFNLTIRCLEL